MLFWQQTPGFGLHSHSINVLKNAAQFRSELLKLILNAKSRIYITALYLEDDEAGREILAALHSASLKNKQLEVVVLVDFHRARRGLIGAAKSDGNAGMYCEYQDKYQSNVKIFGVPIKAKEVFGVLHVKGFVIDDTLLYSGASLNNIYLHFENRYRLDRYFTIKDEALCDAKVQFITQSLLSSDVVSRIDKRPLPHFDDLKPLHKRFERALKKASYPQGQQDKQHDISAHLFLGLGRSSNKLNLVIRSLFDSTEKDLVLYTPYFNLPKGLMRSLNRLLEKNIQVTIVVGDKTANDFFIPPNEPFSKIGALPYLYETILRKFVKTHERHITSNTLNVYLWRHEHNSFHLKGVCCDRKHHLLSGHNLNPRAWALDIENGILIEDPQQHLMPAIDEERQQILQHCVRVSSADDLDTIDKYPKAIRKLLTRARRTKFDSILKRFI